MDCGPTLAYSRWVTGWRTATIAAGGLLVLMGCGPADGGSRGAISSGADHTCALVDGTARCWGWNFLGQLGSGASPTELPETTTPVVVGDSAGPLVDLVQLACGYQHCCARDGSGTVSCWGDNVTGNLGTGSDEFFEVAPARVALSDAATFVTAGGAHTCALADGGLYCWGNNFFGQLGNGDEGNAFAPVRAATDVRFVQLAAGNSHTCALDERGGAYCWGDNGRGQLGDGTREWRRTPTRVAADLSFVQLDAGYGHTCGLTADGLFCWGSNEFGQLGTGEVSSEDQLRPVRVPEVADAVAVAAGLRHTCAISSDGGLTCWGSNSTHQTAAEDAEAIPTPRAVAMNRAVAELALGGTHSCALAGAGRVFCWGDGSRGQLGGSADMSATPVAVNLEGMEE